MVFIAKVLKYYCEKVLVTNYCKTDSEQKQLQFVFCKERCCQKFCEIHRKTSLDDLFYLKQLRKDLPQKLSTLNYLEVKIYSY